MMRLDHLVTYRLSTSRTFNQKVDDLLLILYNFEILGSCWQGSHFPQPFGHIPSHWLVLRRLHSLPTTEFIHVNCSCFPTFFSKSHSNTESFVWFFDSSLPLKLYCLYFWFTEFNGSLFWGLNLIILALPEPRTVYCTKWTATKES